MGSALLDSITAKPGGDSLLIADLDDLIALALLRDERAATDPRAITLPQQSRAIREARLGSEHPEVAKSLCLLARAWMARGDYRSAVDAAERAARLAARAPPPEGAPLAAALCTLGWVRFSAGDLLGADSLLERAHGIRTRVLDPDHPDIAESAELLGIVAWERGRPAEGESLLSLAVQVSRRSLGGDHPLTAVRIGHLGVQRMFAARFPEADSLHRAALAILEGRLPPDHILVGDELLRLGNSLAWEKRFEEAQPCLERSLRIHERWLGPDHESLADPLSSLGDLLWTLGDPAHARPLLERALRIRERVLGPEHPDVSVSLDRLGDFLQANGEDDRARPLFERALAIRRKTQPAGDPDIAWSLDRLGRCYAAEDGNYRRARPLFEEAIPIFLAASAGHPDLARGYALQGELLLTEGRYRESAECTKRALAIYEKLYGDHTDPVAWVRYAEACAYWGLGDWDRASELFRLSSAGFREAHTSSDWAATQSLVSLGVVLMAEGRDREAFDTVMRALQSENRFLRVNARLLTEEQALRLANGRTSALHLAMTLIAGPLRGSARAKRRALDALVRERALVLDEMATRHHLFSARDPGVDSLLEQLVSTSRVYANLQVRLAAEPDSPDGLRARYLEAGSQRDEAERRLAERSGEFRLERAQSRFGLAEVESTLDRGVALVSFVRYGHARPSRSGPGRSRRGATECWGWFLGPSLSPTPRYLAFVLRGGERTPRVVPLGDAREIEALVAGWRREVERAVPSLPAVAPGREDAYRAAAVRLRRAVWDPVSRLLPGARRVFIVPDGALDLVNFATLPVGRTAYLVERGPLLHYLSTERDLAPAYSTPGPGGTLLAVGAPDFDARPDLASTAGAAEGAASARAYRGQRASCDEFRATRFPSLPGSGAEVNEIVSLWHEGESLRLVGAEATETAFKELAPGHEVVHIATHGFFVGASCPTALETLRGIGGTTPEGAAPGPPGGAAVAGPEGPGSLFELPHPDSPLLLAGLALAGANHRDEAPPDGDDGILTAEEIAAMDLSSVRWAVLSACETGVGEVRAGEGVLGLRRAFQVAGARTTIMSLWWVDDDATREWMRALYEARLERGRTTAESVREASLEVLKTRRARGETTHPFTWGAFVAAGDWR